MVAIQLARNLSVPSEKLLSYHIAVSGMTGSGKSRNVSARLLRECLEKRPRSPDGAGYAFIVIDTNSEYFTFQDAYPKRVIVFSPDVAKGVPLRISSRNITVDEISVFLREITKREVSKGDTASLFLAVDELRAKGDYTLEQVYMKLYELEAFSILPAVEKMMNTGIFGPEDTPLSLLVRPGEASIIDLGGYGGEIQAIIFAQLARNLFRARTNKEVGPIVLFIEECSTFAPEGKLSPASDVLRSISTQGRGYDFILVSIFQRSSLTDITLRSQAHNWIIGKTGNPLDRQAVMKAAEKIEAEHDKVIKNLTVGRDFLVTGLMVDEPERVVIPDQKLLARKGGRITQKTIEESFRREDLAKYIQTIRQVEATERKRLEEATARLRAEREAKVKAPAVPKEAQQEIDRLKRSLEATQKRYEDAIARADERIKEKYSAREKELEDTVEQLTKQLTLKEIATESVWDHPLVRKRLNEKLSKQQISLVEFLEKAGASRPEKIAAFLGCKPQTIASYVSKINKEIPDLVGFDGQGGTYHSRLKQVFPVTGEAKRESEEVKGLEASLSERDETIRALKEKLSALAEERAQLLKRVQESKLARDGRLSEVAKERDELRRLVEGMEKSAQDNERERAALEERLSEANSKLAGFSALQEAIRSIAETGRHGMDVKTLREMVRDEISRSGARMGATPASIDVDKLKNEILAQVQSATQTGGSGRIMVVQNKVTSMEIRDDTEIVSADKTTLRGRIALLIGKYGFMQQRHKLSEFVEELSNHRWVHDKRDVDGELSWFCDSGILQRKMSTGKMYWYSLVSGMDENIRIVKD